MAGDENLKDLKSTYDSLIGSQLAAIQNSTNRTAEDVLAIKLALERNNLPEIKQKVNEHEAILTRYDLERISNKVDDHDKFIIRAITVMVMLQFLSAAVLGILNYAKG